MLINECISIAKLKNPHNLRYSENWLLLCLLLKIKSPSGYNFLRINDILPLPSPVTMYCYLKNINTNIGFDSEFFQLLQKKLESLDTLARNDLLVFDEITVQKV